MVQVTLHDAFRSTSWYREDESDCEGLDAAAELADNPSLDAGGTTPAAVTMHRVALNMQMAQQRQGNSPAVSATNLVNNDPVLDLGDEVCRDGLHGLRPHRVSVL